MALHFHPLRVTSVERDTDDAMVVGFEAPADGFAFEPGQYLTLRASVAGQGAAPQATPSVPTAACRSASAGSTAARFRPGCTSSSRPAMSSSPTRRRGASCCRLRAKGATCCSLPAARASTPIIALLTALLEREPRSRATLIYANRRTVSTMFKEELEDLKNRFMTRLSLHLVFSPRGGGRASVRRPVGRGQAECLPGWAGTGGDAGRGVCLRAVRDERPGRGGAAGARRVG